jgi:Arc/MetJ-type ribon-helix-helix transcriptional regulator
METIEMTLGTKERITIRLTKRDLDGLEKLVTDGFFNSRNEAVRTAIRNLIAEKEKENKQL